MTNKSFIVKYIFVDVDVDENIDEKIKSKIDAFLRNSSIKSNNHENFDDIDFEITFAQNICFFNIAKNIANKINSIKINKIIKSVENKINDEIKKDFENICENVKDNASSLNVNETISFDVKISKKIDLNFF